MTCNNIKADKEMLDGNLFYDEFEEEKYING